MAYRRRQCPYCGKMVHPSWVSRHNDMHARGAMRVHSDRLPTAAEEPGPLLTVVGTIRKIQQVARDVGGIRRLHQIVEALDS
jgi:hypothetical protein